MNQPPHHVSDEELSDHFDGAPGELRRHDVEAHLDSCPRCAARVEALGAAAAAVRTAVVEPLDDVTRRRLITRAVQAKAAPVRRPVAQRRFRVLAVAAVTVVAFGVVGMLALSRDERADDALAAGLPIESEHVAGGDIAVDDPGYLESLLVTAEMADRPVANRSSDQESGQAGGMASKPGVGSGSGGASAESGLAKAPADEDAAAETGAAPTEGADGVQTSESQAVTAGPVYAVPVAVVAPKASDLSAAARCYRVLASAIPEDSRLTAAVTGTYQGKRVIVLGFRSSGDRLLAMVLARSDCSIVTAQSFGR